MQPHDPVVEEVRESRRRASQACGHDAGQLVEYYMRLQEQYKERLLVPEPEIKQPEPDAA